MYTGNYECLELFVKPDEGKKGSVLLKNVKESTTETKEPKLDQISGKQKYRI